MVSLRLFEYTWRKRIFMEMLSRTNENDEFYFNRIKCFLGYSCDHSYFPMFANTEQTRISMQLYRWTYIIWSIELSLPPPRIYSLRAILFIEAFVDGKNRIYIHGENLYEAEQWISDDIKKRGRIGWIESTRKTIEITNEDDWNFVWFFNWK